MELVLSAIASGGLVGVSDQYMCLLIVALGARLKWITLAAPLEFMSSWWFIAIVAVFWLVTVLPAYASLLSPGVMNAVNSAVNFLSGFVVPLSAALITLVSAGVIAGIDPELRHMLETLRIFTPEGHVGLAGWGVAGAGGVAALTLTATKGFAKPAISTSTGTVGHVSAPLFATLENLTSVVMMALVYVLGKTDPWLLVALLGGVTLIMLGLLAFAIYQLWRLKRGIGKVLYLTQVYPRAGLAVIAECLVWGSGWLAWRTWGRGVVMLLVWCLWVALFISVPPLIAAMLVVVPPLIPFGVAAATGLMLVIFAGVGLGSARALLKVVEKQVPEPASPTVAVSA